ncbi:MAG: succinate dehydrogenase / fumarate reductase cytochrome b subunit [Saprospiraceae bacterium]|jgi:succinate dehydrogenase / fumarate reductase cytochrome b subunit
MSATDVRKKRPLSPHLQIYKPQITSVLSILHRITGVVASVGVLFVVLWLVALAQSDAGLLNLLQSTLAKVFLVAWSASLFYHLCNGIRHLFWDAGIGLEMDQVRRSGLIVLAATVILTIATWAMLGMQS